MSSDSPHGPYFDLSPSLCFALDDGGLVTQANSAARGTLGFEPAQLAGRPVVELVHEEDRAAVATFLKSEHGATGVRQIDVRMRTRVGGFRWFRWTAGHQGNAQLYVVATDLSHGLSASAWPQHINDPFGLLIETIVDYAIYVIDENGFVSSWNSGARRIKGYDSSDILGKPYTIFFTPEDQAAGIPQQDLKDARDAGRAESEGWRVRKDGTRFWASCILTTLRDPQGRVIGYGKVTRDLTERRLAEERLRSSEERLRLLVEGARDYAIFMIDPMGRVQSWNKGAELLKGYSASEILGSHFSRFYSQEDISARKPARELEIAAREGRVEDEGWRVRRDGSTFWANVVITRLIDEHGTLVGFAKVTRDLTQRRAMEDEIRQYNALLERRVEERTAKLHEADVERRRLEHQLQQSAKMEAVGRLAGGVAHDFNNMLTVIQGNLELLMDGTVEPGGDSMRETLQEIQDAAMRSSELTRQLLAFSRKQVLMPRALQLNSIVAEMKPLLARLLGESVRVETMLSEDLLRTQADPTQIQQVLMNLAVNARDAMPGGGTLTIDTLNTHLDEAYVRTHAEVKPGAYVMLSISDTGAGMDDATRERVFEPFFTTKGPGRGTGLGLSTVHGIVRQSGGHVQVYSEPGRGTTFKVYLPATTAPADVQQAPRHVPIDPAVAHATILLVEDEPPVRRLARSILSHAGYRVLEAGDGKQALEVAANSVHAIDLLLTDVVMPGMNGVELHRELVRSRPAVKSLYMSGYTENAVVHHGILDADVHFLAKPFTREVLLGRVREVLAEPAR
jgi:PAS domain S-box-containing protein